jgi:biotin operon repressor
MPTAATPAPAKPGPATATRAPAAGRGRAKDTAATATTDTTAASAATAADTGSSPHDRSTTAAETAATARPVTSPAPRPALPRRRGAAAPTGSTGRESGSSDTLVLAALTSGHDLTVPEIALTTGLGRSTVAKALNRLAAAGQASRTSGSGSGVTRTPDRWNPAPETPTGTGNHPSTTEDTAARTEAPRATGTPAARKPKRAASTGRATTAAPDASVPAPPNAPTQPTATAQPATEASGGTDAGTADAARNRVTGKVKLQPGALTRLVAGHFAAHPGAALTAGEVGRSLGRSSGAVRNACDKLVRDGDLRLDSDSPRRYALNTGSSTASTASTAAS